MGCGKRVVGKEVPYIRSDSVKWFDASVPTTTTGPRVPGSTPGAPLTHDYASSSIIGTPPTYLIWRIRKRHPNVIEILEISADKGSPQVGLRVLFPEALSPFAYICKNEINSAHGSAYLLYALSVSGIAYLFHLKKISAYSSSFVFSPNELLHFDLNTSPEGRPITAAAAATEGCLVVGRDDGSVVSYRLGVLDESAPGFMHEFKDDAALSRVWGLISRSRSTGGVKDIVISDILGRKVMFVLHSDGCLRVWDLSRRSKLFSQTLNCPGFCFSRLWLGPAEVDGCLVHLGIYHTQPMEDNIQGITVFELNFSPEERYNMLVELFKIPLGKGKLIDVILSCNKIWVLKEDGLLEQDLSCANANVEESLCYSLQEAFIAEQLFQSSQCSTDDLYQTVCSLSMPSKVESVEFVSSIFIRRLLHPGLHNGSVLRSVLEDYGKQWTDPIFQAFTVDELRSEILSLIEHEAVSGSPFTTLKCWEQLCLRYFDRWCKSNAPFCLLVDPLSGALGLVRENDISMFRTLEHIERLVYGTFEDVEYFLKLGDHASNDHLEHEILYNVLHCSRTLHQRLGPAISTILYESLVGVPMISLENIVPRLLKKLVCGSDSPAAAAENVSELGTDVVWQRKLKNHKCLREFSIGSLVALHSLRQKSSGWGKVLNVIENYLNVLVPRKPSERSDTSEVSNGNISLVIQATSQVAAVMFESAVDMLLFLTYLLDVSSQVYLLPHDRSKIQLEIIPMIHEIITEWLIIHFLASGPSQCPSAEDFSSQLSSLTLDGNTGKRSWTDKLGAVNFSLANILLLDAAESPGSWSLAMISFPHPERIISLVQCFSSWTIWGRSGEKSVNVFAHPTELALSLMRHGQYNSVEILLMTVDTHLRNEKLLESVQNADGDWCVLHHLLGCCFLAQANCGPPGPSKERKVCEAMRCFFRASSGEGVTCALQKLPNGAGVCHPSDSIFASTGAWKLHYYQWVMQKFEQYGIKGAACQFALAALEHVDEAIEQSSDNADISHYNESATAIKGRLWANAFKLALDLNQYFDAYCAIVSNPDDESKFICLRRFIIVLCERGATKILCSTDLPFSGLSERVERELAWKAARSDSSARPNSYKLLYAFEMHQQNWRKAATYIYLYAKQLKSEITLKDHQNSSSMFQERLDSIAAAINCLHLVHPTFAWIDCQIGGSHLQNMSHPPKKARIMVEQSGRVDTQAQLDKTHVSLEELEDEFVLTSAEYVLSLVNVKWTHTGNEKLPSDLVYLLVEAKLYDSAFTVVLRFWKDSGLKSELEKVFSTMTLKCCPGTACSPMLGSPSLLLTASKDETMFEGPPDVDSPLKHEKSSQWEVLEQYLEKYIGFHGRLPIVVAETLLSTDPHIELPLWLVHMFKAGRRDSRGMTGQESDPAALFTLYVNYGRYREATELLLEYIEAYATVRPAGIVHRKRPFATWFPYTAIERLWCYLEESIRVGHMTEHCEKLKVLLHGALRSHLIVLKADSEDAISSAVI